jgi:hypothetical protein
MKTDLKIDSSQPGVRLGTLSRLITLPTLVHMDILSTCPDGDIRVARMLGVLMWLSCTWECVLFSNAARVMLSPDGSWQPAFIGLGLIIAMIMLLADAIVFIAASWHAHGLSEVERTHEFKLPTTRAGRLKNASLFGGRFVMAVLIANFMAVTTGLLAFEKDINRILEQTYQTANANLLFEAAQRENAELQKSKASQQELAALIPPMEAEERALRILNLEPKLDEAELRLALQRVATAQVAKAAAERNLKTARLNLIRQRPGDWSGWRPSQELVNIAERDASAARRAVDEAQRRVEEIVDARNTEARRKENLASTRLAEVTARKSDIERQLAELKAAYELRSVSREANIRGMVERDPRYVPRNDGLLVRLQALNELAKDPSIAYALYGFDAILMLLELAAIMGKTFAFIPMTYATRIVEQDLARAIEAGRRLKGLVDGNVPVPPMPIQVAPENSDPVVIKEPPPEMQRPKNRATGPPRHRPRWTPSLQEGEVEPSKNS